MQKYVAKYTVVGQPQGNCAGKLPTAELVNMQYYRTKPNDMSVAPILAIEPQSVFDAVSAANDAMPPVKVDTGTTKEYAIGTFNEYQPDDNNRCLAARPERITGHHRSQELGLQVDQRRVHHPADDELDPLRRRPGP